MKNPEIFKQIEILLADAKKKDKEQYDLAMQLLNEVYTEINTGRNANIEQKIYTLIENIAANNIKRNENDN